MQPSAIFHLAGSSPGSATSGMKRHAPILASIAHNAFPRHLSGTYRLPRSRPCSSKDSPLSASRLAHLTSRTRTITHQSRRH
ncbi:hypothetical protein FIBSPDRAFT_857056 [Athelia psychrophila]|uniref:Uncharacterized protein n=1 Tax=Athelia psychrophila TaxID=1759441 RepID=A0A166MWM5_9AGAM|nr:hypothetical protein FIBSPDRAFT_857056 [Fibularhizoctonia sp. CBS 109695]